LATRLASFDTFVAPTEQTRMMLLLNFLLSEIPVTYTFRDIRELGRNLSLSFPSAGAKDHHAETEPVFSKYPSRIATEPVKTLQAGGRSDCSAPRLYIASRAVVLLLAAMIVGHKVVQEQKPQATVNLVTPDDILPLPCSRSRLAVVVAVAIGTSFRRQKASCLGSPCHRSRLPWWWCKMRIPS